MSNFDFLDISFHSCESLCDLEENIGQDRTLGTKVLKNPSQNNCVLADENVNLDISFDSDMSIDLLEFVETVDREESENTGKIKRKN